MVDFFEMSGGSAYIVTRAFADSDNNGISVNTKLTYDTKLFDPATGNYLVIFRERKLRFNEETSKHIINNLHEYLHEYLAPVDAVRYMPKPTSIENLHEQGPLSDDQRWNDVLTEVKTQAVGTDRPENSKNRISLLLAGVAFFLLGMGTLVTGLWPVKRPALYDTGYIGGDVASLYSVLAILAGAFFVYLAVRRGNAPPPFTAAEREALERLISICEKNNLPDQAEEARNRLLQLVAKSNK